MIHAADVPPIVGTAPAMLRAVSLAQRFASSKLAVLLVGATGTGKDLLARAIHAWSGRAGPLQDVNCGALPRDLAEGILFGHRRGAFTGAVEGVAGLMEAAHGGTLFLDELCSLPLETQVKLLRVLETGEVRRLGETTRHLVDVRIVAAVQSGIQDQVAAGRFRLDLYQRVAGVVLELPPLAHRGDDMLTLAAHFAAQHRRVLGPGAAEVLRRHTWPGNVRELKAAVERATFLTAAPELSGVALAAAIDLGLPAGYGQTADPLAEHRHGERQRLLAVLDGVGWHAGRAARALGIGRTTLFRRCKELGLSLRAGKRSAQVDRRAVPDGEYQEYRDRAALSGTLGA